jgi:hypothetical protein
MNVKSLQLLRSLKIHEMDVKKKTFLNRDLDEEVYME